MPTFNVSTGGYTFTVTTQGTSGNASKLKGIDIEDRSPADGEYLVYDDANSRWSYTSTVGSVTELSDLTDVNTSTATNRNVLVADGVDWESRALTEADISDLQSYLLNVVEDTTPQLGGDLDGQSTYDINNVVNLELEGYQDLVDIAEPSNPSAGTIRLWSEDHNGISTLHYKNSNNVVFEVGHSLFHRVRNTTGGTLSKGAVVYINGSTGNVPTVALADASTAATSEVLGLLAEDIANNGYGLVKIQGDITNIDLSAYNDGDALYLSETAGAFTTTPPTGSAVRILVGHVIDASANGVLNVHVGTPSANELINHDFTTGYIADEHVDHTSVSVIAGTALSGGGTIDGNVTLNYTGALSDQSDVSITSPQSGEALVYDGANWTNTDIATQTELSSHASSDGSSHTFIDQDVTSTASPTFDNETLTGYQVLTDITAPGASSAGTVRIYSEDENGFSFLHAVDENGIALDVGRDTVHVARNETGSTITKGSVVYVTGSNGNVPTVALADASSNATMPAFGVVMADIANNSTGPVLQQGDLAGLDTSAFLDGDEVYVSTTAGELTATAPTGTDIAQKVGTIIKAGAGLSGILKVNTGAFINPTTIDHDQLLNFVSAEHYRWDTDISGTATIDPANITSTAVTQHEASINHDNLSGYVANEHIDWTSDQGATNINASNITGLSIGTEVTGAVGDLSDVTITTLGTDELLFTQDGSTFINQTLAEAGIAEAVHTHTLSDVTDSGSIASQDASSVTITGGSISGITDLAVADGGTGASTASGARTNLGLVIGTDVQAWDSDLDTWATKTAPTGTVVGTSDAQTLTGKDYRFASTNSIGNAGASQTVDLDTSNVQAVTLDQNTTLTIDSTSGDAQRVSLIVRQDATGGRTVTFSAGAGFTLEWPGGSAPTITSGANAEDIITFILDDDTNKIYGVATQDFS